MNYRMESLFMLSVIIFAVLFCGFMAFVVAQENNARSVCLAHGYPSVTHTYAFTYYCVRRVNQTDEVVPVWELR